MEELFMYVTIQPNFPFDEFGKLFTKINVILRH